MRGNKGDKYYNAQEAFEHKYNRINKHGIEGNGTRRFTNQTMIIMNPLDNVIKTDFRKWSLSYAKVEWLWYMSGNRSVSEIKKIAKIWDTMHSGDDIVNSNYGYQWRRNDQMDNVIMELARNPNSRRAWITIGDMKEHRLHEYDTPCTMSIGFNIINKKLNMMVHMRSNDLWFGFCNDQYCFSLVQRLVANELGIDVGWYSHHASDLHIYERHYDKN